MTLKIEGDYHRPTVDGVYPSEIANDRPVLATRHCCLRSEHAPDTYHDADEPRNMEVRNVNYKSEDPRGESAHERFRRQLREGHGGR